MAKNVRLLDADGKPIEIEYQPLTKELAAGYSTYHQSGSFDSKGNCRIWRANGAMKTWKRRPNAFQVPVKYGMYDYGYVADYNADHIHVDETCPFALEEEREA